MIEVIDSEHGYLPKGLLQKYGGAYSLLDQLLNGAASSVKIVYESGLPAYDELRAYVENEPIFVSFQRLRGALVLRANKSQRLRLVIIPYIHIREIYLQPLHHRRISLDRASLERYNTEGTVTLNVYQHAPIQFYIPGRNDRAILRFFQHRRFSEILQLPESR